jgi:hypothetical protein
VISFSYWSIKLLFRTEGKLTDVLIIPSSWGFPTGPVRHQDYFLTPFLGRKRISVRGVSHFQSLYFVIVLLSFFALFCLLLFYQKHKKIVPTIVVIFVGLLLSCFLLALSCFLSMVDFFETRSYWQGGFTEEQQKYYKEHFLSQKGKNLW